LIAIATTSEGETFEIQIKVRIADPELVITALHNLPIEILHERHYHEFDSYFAFEDPKQGHLRYREDEFLGENGEIKNVRYRLTLIGREPEGTYPSDVLLKRSRFIAPASHSRRFYKEYFKPISETVIEKNRRRWRILFQGTEFYVNVDKVVDPDLGYFLEVKSRTWSRRDAEHKAVTAIELIKALGAKPEEAIPDDYIEIVKRQGLES
jgi:5-methylthioadenosine/S-adenosylhomocysteine deaminase